jgi:hypothetical protein
MDAEHRLRQLLSEKSADIYSPLKTPEAEDRRLAAWQYVTDTWNIENDGKKATLKEVQNLSYVKYFDFSFHISRFISVGVELTYRMVQKYFFRFRILKITVSD